MIMRGDQTLVIRRGPGVGSSGFVCAVSGMVEPGEEEPETVVREVREEVGLEVRPIRRIWECPSVKGNIDLHWWLAEYVSGELELDPVEVSDAWWIMPAEFVDLDTTFADDCRFYAEVLPVLLESASDAV